MGLIHAAGRVCIRAAWTVRGRMGKSISLPVSQHQGQFPKSSLNYLSCRRRPCFGSLLWKKKCCFRVLLLRETAEVHRNPRERRPGHPWSILHPYAAPWALSRKNPDEGTRQHGCSSGAHAVQRRQSNCCLFGVCHFDSGRWGRCSTRPVSKVARRGCPVRQCSCS